jgi:hypothetical protein
MSLADLLRQIDVIFKNCRISYAVIGGYLEQLLVD